MSASDFPALSNDRLLRALRREPVDRTPVWMMRQAGRYLPEYRATRAQAGDFMSLCKNADLACEVTLQPLRRYPLDAAILFSDILTIPDAMGLQLYFENGEGPRFKRCIRSAADVAALPKLNAEVDLDYVMRAVHTIRHSLAGQVPLIGFSGSPWTLATYMIEGAGSKDFALAKAMLYRDPDTLHALLTHLATAVTDYLLAQIKAGVQVVQVFDTWGGALAHHAFQEFSLQYMTQIVACIKESAPHVPIIVFTKGAGQWLELMADSGADALGLDWTTDLGAARRRVGDRVTLQGNMDPAVLYAEPEQIRQEVQRLLARFGPGSGHVFNLGHGITPGVDPEAARVFIEAVVEFSPAWHEWGTDQASAST